MEHPFKRRVRVQHARATERKVKEALQAGDLTAREMAVRIFGNGDTRTPGRSLVGKALITLEMRGEVSRDIRVGLRGADHWFETGHVSDGRCQNGMVTDRDTYLRCPGFLRVLTSRSHRLKCDGCGGLFVENQSFTTQSIEALLGRPVTPLQVVS